jgi:hypothetical protein
MGYLKENEQGRVKKGKGVPLRTSVLVLYQILGSSVEVVEHVLLLFFLPSLVPLFSILAPHKPLDGSRFREGDLWEGSRDKGSK